MTNAALNTALNAIYDSIKNNNEGLDAHIASLKAVLHAQNAASVEIDPSRLIQPNRQGRKLMQSYFKKRGVVVTFAEGKAVG